MTDPVAMPLRIAVGVDDTDDLTKTTSTGKVAGALAEIMRDMGATVEMGITRHQLPMLEQIPYTSHNSAMAFVAAAPAGFDLDAYREAAVACVVAGSMPSADPGLCIYRVPSVPDEGFQALLQFGVHTKVHYVTKAQAYDVAATVPGLTLTEHGGEGIGVIGALAGVALRLSGSDGRFRGKKRLYGVRVAVALDQLVSDLGGPGHAQVCDASTQIPLSGEVMVGVPDLVKPILLEGKLTLLADPGADGTYRMLGWDQVREQQEAQPPWRAVCDEFEDDNDIEEFVDPRQRRLCANCLWRRWTLDGFTCTKGIVPTAVTI